MSTDLVRQEWEQAHRRLEAERDDPALHRRRLDQVEVVTDELRRRMGQTYTLGELDAAYRDAERWARQVVEERAPGPGWPRDLVLVLAAAFHAYQRGAADFAS